MLQLIINLSSKDEIISFWQSFHDCQHPAIEKVIPEVNGWITELEQRERKKKNLRDKEKARRQKAKLNAMRIRANEKR